MGIYADISADIIEALDGDLADASKTVNLISYGTSSYDPVTGTNTPSETPYSFRAVRLEFEESDEVDEATRKGGLKLLVMDTEKPTGLTFKVNQQVTLSTETQTYSILTTEKDPADITHTLICTLKN